MRLVLPLSRPPRLALGEVAAHRERRVGQVQRVAVRLRGRGFRPRRCCVFGRSASDIGDPVGCVSVRRVERGEVRARVAAHRARSARSARRGSRIVALRAAVQELDAHELAVDVARRSRTGGPRAAACRLARPPVACRGWRRPAIGPLAPAPCTCTTNTPCTTGLRERDADVERRKAERATELAAVHHVAGDEVAAPEQRARATRSRPRRAPRAPPSSRRARRRSATVCMSRQFERVSRTRRARASRSRRARLAPKRKSSPISR